MSDTRSPLMQMIDWLLRRNAEHPNTGANENAAPVATVASQPSAPEEITVPSGSSQFEAPLSGKIIPLEAVPDPAFAQRVVGDGIAIEPTNSVLTSPCEATVISVEATGHAINLRNKEGADLLIHIGIDTVAMKGKGFQVLVKAGQRVGAGEPLISFDLALIKAEATSSITLILLTNKKQLQSIESVQGEVVANDGVVMTAHWKAVTKAKDAGHESYGPMVTTQVQIPNPQGWHARPASQLVALAGEYQARISVTKEGQKASAESIVQLMALNTHCGDKVEIQAQGEQAEEAIEAISQAIRDGLGDNIQAATDTASQVNWEQEPPLINTSAAEGNVWKGVKASPGLGWGNARILTDAIEPDASTVSNIEQEQAKFKEAISQAISGLQQLAESSAESAEIFTAQIGFLKDKELESQCLQSISSGVNAEQAIFEALESQIKTLLNLDNSLLAGRAADLRDVRLRVLRVLRGQPQDLASLPAGSVVVVDELIPSVAASLDAGRIQAVVACHGGAFSHGAIIARAKGIPAVFALGERIHSIEEGTMLLVQADSASVELEPDDQKLAQLKQEQQRRADNRDIASRQAHDAAITLDGIEIEVAANIANDAEASQAVNLGTDGVGLLRSEFLFLDRPTPPDEEEQYQTYRAILGALDGRPLIVRTLDVGGDKPLPYLPLPAEENPFLGERGIRVGICKPAILRQQLRALLRASVHGPMKIMLPMITTVQEFRVVKAFAKTIAEELSIPLCPLGIMIEVPSAALQADTFAREVDFFSIGSNDLAQYVTAVDRGHAGLDYLADPLNPGLLRLMSMAATAAQEKGVWVGLCGGLAGDLDATPLLVGMGLSELSVSAPVIAEVKQRIRQLDSRACQTLLQQCLNSATSDEVRELLTSFTGNSK
ncbi:phosphoenolpyruvate--protein phosphotransferase [Reinekea marinisedimentorum]|uniref:phosphoenolpyruvate--protein phosphotransferase n=1 Tax=Reinekea marinisedimentorum TaxID=230495 RepID=A0A4R3IAS9_9GAMM|nr:phosphoenolpyruvate--protein phosphotransferase [Reinekea marinisedimentorum]TCS42351.1 phosphocarrier protein FPr [Reinekea marinisedimentorum]